MRKTRKIMALVLALSMIMVLFAGVAQASVNVSIGSSVTTVLPDGARTPGRIDVATAAQPAVAAGERTVVRATLPAGVTWVADVVAANVTTTPTTATATTTGQAREDDNRTAIFTVVAGAADISSIRFSGLNINVPAGFSGAINAEVVVTGQTAAGDFVWEQRLTVRIAEVAAAGTTSTAITTPNVLRGVAAQRAGNIRIRENIVGSLPDTGEIAFLLPSGVTFQAIAAGAVIDPLNARRATTTLTAVAALQTINITGIDLRVDGTVPDGPINVQISGPAGLTAAIVQIATVGVVGAVTVSRHGDLPAVWNLGRVDRPIGTIRIAENLAGALRANSVVTLTLPEGYTWHTAPNDPDAFGATPSPALSNGNRTLTYWTLPGMPATRQDFDLTGGRINANAATATPGEVVVTVGGTAGAAGTATVATSRRPVTVTAVTTPNVRVNSLNQAVGNITITEAVTGIFRDGTLTVTFPVGTSIAAAGSASATVTAGTAPTLGAVTASANVITINVSAGAFVPTQPATITLSGVRINTDGTPMRPIVVDVAGTSILDRIARVPAGSGIAGGIAVEEADMEAAAGTLFADDLLVANVVTATAQRTVFTVDSTNSTVDGVAQPALDVAPVIVDGRTFMPIRAAAAAAGVTGDNILFDAGVITIIRGDRVAQFTLGSRVVVVNGVAMNMDVAPSLVAGRALIPIRWVGTALGVPVLWDATARTITVTVQ